MTAAAMTTLALLAVAVALVIASVHAAAPTADVLSNDLDDSYFVGRSGDAYLTTKLTRDLHAVLIDSAEYLSALPEAASISLYALADVSARALGFERLSEGASVAVVKSDLFTRPTLALTIVVDGAAIADVNALTEMSGVKVSAAVSAKSLNALTPSVTYAASLATSAAPSAHGVVGWRWKTNHATVNAYERAQAAHMTASLADVAVQSTNGQSVVVSFAQSKPIARAHGVHHSVNRDDDLINVITSDDGAFTELSSNRFRSTFDEIDAALTSAASILTAAHATLDTQANTVTVSVNGRDVTVAVDEQVSAFLLELQYVADLPALMRAAYPLQFDDVHADTIAVTLKAIKAIAKTHGADSDAVIVARAILNAALPVIVQRFMQLAPQRSIATVLTLSHVTKPKARIIGSATLTFLPPNIYFDRPSMERCKRLITSLSTAEIEVHCADSATMRRAHSFTVLNTGNTGPLNSTSPWNASIAALFSNGTFPMEDDIERWQITLWFSVALVVIAFYAVYALACMEFKKDTLLYSGFNPNWEDRKRR